VAEVNLHVSPAALPPEPPDITPILVAAAVLGGLLAML